MSRHSFLLPPSSLLQCRPPIKSVRGRARAREPGAGHEGRGASGGCVHGAFEEAWGTRAARTIVCLGGQELGGQEKHLKGKTIVGRVLAIIWARIGTDLGPEACCPLQARMTAPGG